MQETIIDLHVSLPEADGQAAGDVRQRVREFGLFGFQSIGEAAPDSVHFGLVAQIDHSGAGTELSLPILTHSADSPIARVSDLDERLAVLAGHIGFPCYFYEPQTDWELIVDSPDLDSQDRLDSDSDSTSDDDEGLELVPDRCAFIIYSEVTSPDRFVYELARDIKGPVTLIPGAPTIGFAVDGYLESPVWLDKRPVLEVAQCEQVTVTWYASRAAGDGSSKQGLFKKGFVAERILDRITPRYSWTLTNDPHAPLTHEPLQDQTSALFTRSRSPELRTLLDAQEASLQTASDESALDLSDDIAAAHELARQLGLEASRGEALVSALTTSDRVVPPAELIAALGLPPTTEQALAGAIDPRTLEGAVTAEKANFRAETGLHNFTERPTGKSFTDKLRLLDHDRPVLALGLIILMFAASAGALYLGITRPSIFVNLAFTICAYVLGIILLVDSVTSLVSWIMIRLKSPTRK